MTHDAENVGDGQAAATMRLAREIRQLRKAANLSQPQLAAKIGYSRQYVSLAERPGRGLASAELVRAIDGALSADGALITLRERAVADQRARRARDSSAAMDTARVRTDADGRVMVLPNYTAADQDGDDVRRRTLLGLLGPIVLTSPLVDGLEELRKGLDGMLHTKPTGRDADDWEQVVSDYAHAVGALPETQLLSDLMTDFTEIHLRIAEASGVLRIRLIYCAAQLATLTAIALLNLGEPRSSERWWRTASRAADETSAPELAALVRGRHAVFSLYSAPRARVLALAEAALLAGQGVPCVGVISGLAARAQALAEIGRHGEATRSLQAVTDMYERLPARVTTDRVSQWNWSEQRLRHVESYVHTYAGRLDHAGCAQDAALALYPADNFQGRAQIELHRAAALIRSGDISSGAQHLIVVLGRLQPQQRTDGIVMRSAISTLNTVPDRDRGYPSVVDAQELVAAITSNRR